MGGEGGRVVSALPSFGPLLLLLRHPLVPSILGNRGAVVVEEVPRPEEEGREAEGVKSKRECKRGVYIYVFAKQLKYFVLCPAGRECPRLCETTSLSAAVCAST